VDEGVEEGDSSLERRDLVPGAELSAFDDLGSDPTTVPRSCRAMFVA